MENLGYAYVIFPRDPNLDFLACQLAVLNPDDVDNTTTWIIPPVLSPLFPPATSNSIPREPSARSVPFAKKARGQPAPSSSSPLRLRALLTSGGRNAGKYGTIFVKQGLKKVLGDASGA